MPHRFIASAPGLPPAPSAISQAVSTDSHCYVSGQLAVDSTGVYRAGTAREEAELAFRNLFTALGAAGFAATDLVFVDITCIDLADLSEINAVWDQLFPLDRRPARTIAQVVALPYGGRIKVQGVAVRER